MQTLWLKDLPWSQGGAALAAQRTPGLVVWRSLDGSFARAYLESAMQPDGGWTALRRLCTLNGASCGMPAPYHYVVETDVAPEHEAELNAWYDQEHLPGLAAVPGTVRAARWQRSEGAPRFLACYDLGSSHTVERPEWLAVRHTAWSARVRPLFLNPRRTMFHRPHDASSST
jgi:hypothetical protein